MESPDLSPSPSQEVATRARFVLSVWLAGAAAIAYLCRNCLAVAESTIRSDLSLTEDQMGLILGPLFFWSYALAQLPGGQLGEWFGARRCLPVFAAIWSVATALSGLAWGAALLVVGRLASGAAQAGLFPCAVDTLSRWHPPTERAFVSGVLGAAMQVGAAIAAPLTALLLIHHDSWRIMLAIYAIPGLLWAAGFYWWFRDRIEDHPSANDAEVELVRGAQESGRESAAAETEPVPWGRLLSSWAMWIICGQQFFRAAAYVWFSSWFPTYLQESRGVTREASGWLTAIPLVAMLVAALASGGLSDWVLRRTGSYGLARKGVALVSLMICSGLVFQAYFISNATLATISIGAGAFFAACAGPCAYAITIDMGGRHVASVFAVMNMIGNFGSGLLPLIVPKFRRLVDNSPALLELSGGNSWNAVLVLFAAMYVLAAACWLMLRTEGTVFDRSTRAGRSADE
jgi:sugar phosphate permease